MGDHLMTELHAGDRVHSRPEDNVAMHAQAQTLVECCRVATLAIMPEQALAQMGDVGVAGASIQAAMTAVLRTTQAQKVTTYDGIAFAVGLAFGEILRHAQALDLGAIMERLGEGIGHAMEHGRPQPTGGMN